MKTLSEYFGEFTIPGKACGSTEHENRILDNVLPVLIYLHMGSLSNFKQRLDVTATGVFNNPNDIVLDTKYSISPYEVAGIRKDPRVGSSFFEQMAIALNTKSLPTDEVIALLTDAYYTIFYLYTVPLETIH